MLDSMTIVNDGHAPQLSRYVLNDLISDRFLSVNVL